MKNKDKKEEKHAERIQNRRVPEKDDASGCQQQSDKKYQKFQRGMHIFHQENKYLKETIRRSQIGRKYPV